MNHKSPTQKTVLQNRLHIEALVKTKKLLETYGDLDIWCESLGLEYVRSKNIPHAMRAAIIGETVFVPYGLTKVQEVWAIGHEYFHHKFHAAVVTYRELDEFTIRRHESEAICFADSLVMGL